MACRVLVTSDPLLVITALTVVVARDPNLAVKSDAETLVLVPPTTM